MKSRTQLAIAEMLGVTLIVPLGSCLHFVFEWSGNSLAVAVIGAVNESTWEHLKLAYWPSIAWTMLEFAWLRSTVENLAWAKAVGVATSLLCIVLGAFAIDRLLDSPVLAVHICLFAGSVSIGQAVSWSLLRYGRRRPGTRLCGIFSLVVLAIAFGVFTFRPPKLPLWRDPTTGTYGIPQTGPELSHVLVATTHADKGPASAEDVHD